MTSRKKPGFFYFPLTAEYTAIWIAALIGLIMSWAGLWIIKQQLNAHKRLDFEWVAHNRARALKHGIENGLEAVTSVRDLYLASQGFERAEFQLFTRSLLKRYQGIQALMWVPRVSHSARKLFENETKRISPQFRITEKTAQGKMTAASRRNTYFPVFYAAPLWAMKHHWVLIWVPTPLFAKPLTERWPVAKWPSAGVSS